ncbi:MAG: TIGR04282 family arsenosugar biosynthesis glycosyltransferase [Gemmatimonadota bacterium]|nr:TIGR04282 family arsenosugar biosynthesis glycosyltransferase [Gemmatimonadota bacterium]
MKPHERLIYFGRLPEPGLTKTRLQPRVGPEGAARLYQSFLDDLVARDVGVSDRELWVPDRPGARSTLGSRYPDLGVRLQPGGDLGARLAAAFSAAFDDGVDYAVIVGSDHPTLPADYLRRAFRALRGAHLVLGPTGDGGYYAVGLRRYCWPRARGLFAEAPWSEPRLLEWTRERAVELDLCHVELPAWYDVDTPEDLSLLRNDVQAGSATARTLVEIIPEDDTEHGHR